MPENFKAAYERVKQLAADFKAGEKHYLSPAYQEQEARRDFIDKFWMSLGWDVNHETQKNPFEQEVKVERRELGHSQRRADYAFYLAPNFRDVKFYVEAKKPHGDIATPDNYFQTIRYGWSSSTPIAVLHDFEQFEILDCRYRPHIDTALGQNIRKYHFSHYEDPEKFAEIYWLFSREAVASNSLEKFAATLPKRRGRAVQCGLIGTADQTIDDSFLEELDQFRDELARAFKNRNTDLDGEMLTELTQRTLDRLVFLRFLEDKHIEPQNRIAYFGDKSGSVWQDFIVESRRLDGIYNGIVYKEHGILDSPKFKLDDEVFSGICERLSHLNSPYDFNAIPIHILGSIYERFLGKVIVTTDKRARLEEKPEVRKAGGVYYTPEYIVRYIVENTVGKLIAGKSPAQIAEMRFADIACGSGSFLLGVYDLLIRYHTKLYNENPGKAKKSDVVERDDGLHLSLQKKREILLNNIYGVDIDPQAVEVAQLSLYLKLLQDETPGSARNYQLEFHETLLPSLNKNIVCGNSLIGTDILSGQLFASDEERKLNPMDFEQRFPHIFKSGPSALRETGIPLDLGLPGVPVHGSFSYKKKKMPKAAPPSVPEFEGGFDAVVGNPPYGAETNSATVQYLRTQYTTIANSLDTFIAFVERASILLKPKGSLGYIIPSGWVSTPSSRKLRHLFVSNFRPQSFVSLPYDVFDGAYIDAMIVTAEKSCNDPGWKQEKDAAIDLFVFPVRHKISDVSEFEGFRKTGNFAHWLASPDSEFLVTASANEAQLVSKLRAQTQCFDDHVEVMRGVEEFHPRVATGMKHPTRAFNGEMRRYSLDLGPRAFEDYTKDIEAAKPARFFTEARVLLRQLLSRKFRLQAVWTEEKFLTNQSVQSLIHRAESAVSLKAALGILNSRLISWFFCQINMVARRDDFPKTIIKQTRELPFPNDFPPDSETRMTKLVEQMVAAKKQLAAAQSDKDKDFYTNRCDGLDRQIDALVYELYGLTADEIKIVEHAVANEKDYKQNS